VAAGIERGRGDKEDMLRFDETNGSIVEQGSNFTHGYS
jgi:hypothetical protein